MNSLAVFHGLSLRTTRIVGSAEINAIGANWSMVKAGGRPKSLSASGMMEIDESASSSVYPSGLLVATYCIPTAPAAPTLLTTPTGFFRTFSMAAATGRAVRSATPPGGNGATIVIGRDGYGSSATAVFHAHASASSASTRELVWSLMARSLPFRPARAGRANRASW